MSLTYSTTRAKERHALIRPLFDTKVGLAVTAPQDILPAPFPEELACLSSNAVPKRRAEFAAGRAAARQAMHDLGVAAQPILVAPSRAPQWPAGVVGSISHTKTCAMAVVAPAIEWRGIGVDVEEDTPLKRDLWPAICLDTEQDWLLQQNNPGQLAKVIFSAKEAAYKCQYLISNAFFGFDGMRVEIKLSDTSFVASFTQDRAPFQKGDQISGRFAIGAGVIVTMAELRA